MTPSPPANTGIATRQDIDVFHSELLQVVDRETRRSLRWMVVVMVLLHGATVGLLTLTLG